MGKADEIRCSTEGSTGVVLSDLRNVDRPGACIAAPCAMLRGCVGVGLPDYFLVGITVCGVEGLSQDVFLAVMLFDDCLKWNYSSLYVV